MEHLPLSGFLRNHHERHVASKRATGRGHGDVACRRASGNSGKDERVGLHNERRGSSVQQDGGGSGEALAENAELLTKLRRIVNKRDERAEACIEVEQSSAAVTAVATIEVSTNTGGSVKRASSVLNQARHRLVAFSAE